jgi:hypothetical protein
LNGVPIALRYRILELGRCNLSLSCSLSSIGEGCEIDEMHTGNFNNHSNKVWYSQKKKNIGK